MARAFFVKVQQTHAGVLSVLLQVQVLLLGRNEKEGVLFLCP